jgi:GNAT superfamily N-acetyltransferase
MSILHALLGRTRIVKSGFLQPDRTNHEPFTSYMLLDKAGSVYDMFVHSEYPLEWPMYLDDRGRQNKKEPAGLIQLSGWSRERPDNLVIENIQIVEPAHRHQGLGTAMLRKLLDIARENGVKHIQGRVVENDIRETPGLLDWYRREGFSVRSNATETRATLQMRF